jgi:hypothetical protein
MRQVVVAALLVVLSPAAAAAAERTIAQVDTPTRSRPIGTVTAFPVLDAHGGRLVWSEWDGARWRLMEHSGGTERAVPVPPRATPFDVDLGPDGHGGTVAVYSRCRRALPFDLPAPDPRLYTRGRRYGCDLYAYSFASGRERRLAGSSRDGDEVWPAVWGKRFAFVRTYPDRPGRRGRIPYLYWRGDGGTRRLRRPSSTVRIDGRPVRRPFGISGLDMRFRTVAYTWERADDPDEAATFVYLATTGGALRPAGPGATLGGGAATSVRRVGSPALTGRGLHWLFQNRDEPEYFGAFLRRAGSPRASRRTKAVAFAHDGRSAFWIDGGPGAVSYPENQPGGSFALRADDALTYGAVPRGWLPMRPPR